MLVLLAGCALAGPVWLGVLAIAAAMGSGAAEAQPTGPAAWDTREVVGPFVGS